MEDFQTLKRQQVAQQLDEEFKPEQGIRPEDLQEFPVAPRMSLAAYFVDYGNAGDPTDSYRDAYIWIEYQDEVITERITSKKELELWTEHLD